MGHALHEAFRVLNPGGCVLDIRPYFPVSQGNRRDARQQVYCQVEKEEILVGTLARDYVDFYFADRVVADAVRDRRFVVNCHEVIRFRYYHDSLATFDLYRADKWDKARMSVSDRRHLERTMLRHPATVIWVDLPVQFRVLTKL